MMIVDLVFDVAAIFSMLVSVSVLWAVWVVRG